MKKILNPFTNSKDHNYECFGCSPKNDIGLKLEFWDAGEEIICYWKPQKQFEGYTEVVHGGIQATIMDEIASWAVYTKCQTAGVTSNLNIKYRQPLKMEGNEIVIKAKIESQHKKLVNIKTTIENAEGKLCAEGIITYFIFPVQIAKEKYMYPGIEAFYKKTP